MRRKYMAGIKRSFSGPWALFGFAALFAIITLSLLLLSAQPKAAYGSDGSSGSQPAADKEDDQLEVSGKDMENDIPSQATAIQFGCWENLRCLDPDWYKITLSEEMALKISILFSNSQNGNLDLILYRQGEAHQDEGVSTWSPGSSEWIASSFSQTDNEEIIVQAQPGTYYCQVFSSTPGADNRYTLKIEGFSYTPTIDLYQWIELSEKGEPLSSLASDDSFEEVAIGFPFFFFGQEITSLLVSSNGYLTLVGDYATEPENNNLQSITQPLKVIAPFWDDLNPEPGGGVYAWLDEESSPRRFIIEWHEICSYQAAAKGAISFEVILWEGSNTITFQYQDLIFRSPQDGYSYGQSATVGLKYAQGNQVLSRLYSYNGRAGNYPDLAEGLAISFAPSKTNPYPYVLSSVPDSRDPDSLFFPLNKAIVINFSKPMNPELTSAAFSIAPPTQGRIQWLNNNQRLQFQPDGYWAAHQLYTVSVSQMARDAEGLMLAAAFQFTFITDQAQPPEGDKPDTIPPQAVLYLDGNSTDNVSTSAKIYLAFTEPMVPRSVERAISFVRSGGGEVAYMLTMMEDETLWCISPRQALAYDTTYQVEVRTSATDQAQNALAAAVSLSFKTQKAPPISGLGLAGSGLGGWSANSLWTGYSSNWTGYSSSQFSMPSQFSTLNYLPSNYNYLPSTNYSLSATSFATIVPAGTTIMPASGSLSLPDNRWSSSTYQFSGLAGSGSPIWNPATLALASALGFAGSSFYPATFLSSAAFSALTALPSSAASFSASSGGGGFFSSLYSSSLYNQGSSLYSQSYFNPLGGSLSYPPASAAVGYGAVSGALASSLALTSSPFFSSLFAGRQY